MFEAHDIVASKKYDSTAPPSFITSTTPSQSNGPTTEAIRMVGIRKTDEEPLGITVRNEEDGLVIARILAGGIIDRQGLLLSCCKLFLLWRILNSSFSHVRRITFIICENNILIYIIYNTDILGLLNVGDTILEVNGVEIHTPAELQQQLQKSMGSVTFKIRPSNTDLIAPAQTYVKALYAYDPSKDSLLPCKDIGLAFKQGDILQILNQDDPNWWQVIIFHYYMKSWT